MQSSKICNPFEEIEDLNYFEFFLLYYMSDTFVVPFHPVISMRVYILI